MKSLVSNYSNYQSTEALYLNTVLNMCGCESTLWPQNISTYDIFDLTKPDIHITHHNYVTTDLLHYLKDTNSKVDIIINITGMDQDRLTKFESVFLENSIEPAFFFINRYDHGLKTKKINIVTLLNSADIFLGSKPSQYNIDYAIFIDDEKQIKPIGETYHFFSHYDSLSNVADLFFPVDQLANLYTNYNNIVFKFFNSMFPQTFFDAALRNNNVFFDLDDRTLVDQHLKKLLGDDGACDINKKFHNLSDKIKEKHTCLHRTKSLLSQLPCKDYTDKLQQIIEGSIIK